MLYFQSRVERKDNEQEGAGNWALKEVNIKGKFKNTFKPVLNGTCIGRNSVFSGKHSQSQKSLTSSTCIQRNVPETETFGPLLFLHKQV